MQAWVKVVRTQGVQRGQRGRGRGKGRGPASRCHSIGNRAGLAKVNLQLGEGGAGRGAGGKEGRGRDCVKVLMGDHAGLGEGCVHLEGTPEGPERAKGAGGKRRGRCVSNVDGQQVKC